MYVPRRPGARVPGALACPHALPQAPLPQTCNCNCNLQLPHSRTPPTIHPFILFPPPCRLLTVQYAFWTTGYPVHSLNSKLLFYYLFFSLSLFTSPQQPSLFLLCSPKWDVNLHPAPITPLTDRNRNAHCSASHRTQRFFQSLTETGLIFDPGTAHPSRSSQETTSHIRQLQPEPTTVRDLCAPRQFVVLLPRLPNHHRSRKEEKPPAGDDSRAPLRLRARAVHCTLSVSSVHHRYWTCPACF